MITQIKNMLTQIKAFTLIELLIASALSSVIILSLYSAFKSGILSYEKIDSASSIYQETRLALNKIDSDLKNSFCYRASDSGFTGSNQTMEFFSNRGFFKSGRLYPAVNRIKYEFNGITLTRTILRNLEAINDDAQEQTEILLSGTDEINFKYAYKTGDLNKPIDYQNEWPKPASPEQLKSAPCAVKIILKFNETKFNKTISIPISN